MAFHAYLETIVAANRVTGSNVYSEERLSPWLTMDAAHTIFTLAKRRCYVNIPALSGPGEGNDKQREAEQDIGWEVLDELQGTFGDSANNLSKPQEDTRSAWEKGSGRPWWLPREIDPVLEEPPKWSLLAEVLYEIEIMISDNPGFSRKSPAAYS